MKYGNRKSLAEGIEFDSKAEAMRFLQLRAREQNGEISELRLQVKFQLTSGGRWRNGKMHRKTYYIADFVYLENGQTVVEDVKGFRTAVYKLKRELMKEIYDIEIREVQA